MRLQISRLQIARLMAAAFCVFCVTAVYAAQAKPAATAKPAAAAAKASPESIASGETIYKRQCQMCHGATGVGDGPAATCGFIWNFTPAADRAFMTSRAAGFCSIAFATATTTRL